MLRNSCRATFFFIPLYSASCLNIFLSHLILDKLSKTNNMSFSLTNYERKYKWNFQSKWKNLKFIHPWHFLASSSPPALFLVQNTFHVTFLKRVSSRNFQFMQNIYFTRFDKLAATFNLYKINSSAIVILCRT